MFLTVAHNKFTRNRTTIEERYPNRVVFDIQGNEREILDPLHRTIMRRRFDMASRPLRVASADAGETITATDVAGKPIRVFDSRDHATRLTYDPLRRLQYSYIEPAEARNGCESAPSTGKPIREPKNSTCPPATTYISTALVS